MLRKLTEAQCRAAMASGEFDEGTRTAGGAVAIVLTQSWCPQWHWMRAWLEAEAAGAEILWIEYDLEPFFDEFRSWKEQVLGNDQVPYLRYYSGGVLKRESNYIDRSGFRRLLGIAAAR